MKFWIIGLLGLLILFTAGFIVFSGKPGNDSSTVNQSDSSINIAQKEDTKLSQLSSESSTPGYILFSEANLASTVSNRRVVFFHANWCSTCNFFNKQIIENGVPAGITILKADYDNDKDLKKRYGVNIQSTFVLLDKDGNVLRKWPFASGLKSIQDLYDAVLK